MSPDLAITVHLAGFVTGLALYAMLLVMTLQHRRADPSGNGPSVRSRLMACAVSVLGLLWNAIAFLYFMSRDVGQGSPSPWLGATGYAALGFLPAVVVHSALQTSLRTEARWLAPLAYALSAAAAGMQYADASNRVVPSPFGLQVLTAGYAVIVVALLAIFLRAHVRWQRSFIVVALAAFAVSALHLSRPESQGASWPVELVGHHASLPLVLVLLYQDYRFAFADLFLKRALSLLLLVGTSLGLHALLLDDSPGLVGAMQGSETLVVSIRHVGLWVLTALLYPYMRRGVGFLVDRIVLDRADYRAVREDLNNALQRCTTEGQAVAVVREALAVAFGSDAVAVAASDAVREPEMTSAVTGRGDVRVPVATTDAPAYLLCVSNLPGGRRLLSDDHTFLEWVSSSLARKIDALRMAEERFRRDLREGEIVRLATEAELQSLRAQLNPHFLFNALTTIAYLLQASPQRALETLYRLTHLLRGVLRRTNGTFTTLGEEIELIESYVAIERARFEERLSVEICVPASLHACRIPPLVLQPLVENAIKHGVSALPLGGAVTVMASSYGSSSEDPARLMLLLEVADNGVGLVSGPRSVSDGVGLANIENRLLLHFGASARLELKPRPGGGACARVHLPLMQTETPRVALAAG